MVKGLNLFIEHFKEYKDQYVIIGGTATDLLFEKAGLEFRSTKDLDIVLITEALSQEFVAHFWDFILLGGYRFTINNNSSTLYRFDKPQKDEFPYMIELLSKNTTITIPSRLKQRIVIDDTIVSLSALMLEDSYYKLIKENLIIGPHLNSLGAEVLIALKAKAYLNLLVDKENNVKVKSTDIKKHRNDCIRLVQTLIPSNQITVDRVVKDDIFKFCQKIESDNIDLKQLGINISLENIVQLLKNAYTT